jgi:hypothetical protein
MAVHKMLLLILQSRGSANWTYSHNGIMTCFLVGRIEKERNVLKSELDDAQSSLEHVQKQKVNMHDQNTCMACSYVATLSCSLTRKWGSDLE